MQKSIKSTSAVTLATISILFAQSAGADKKRQLPQELISDTALQVSSRWSLQDATIKDSLPVVAGKMIELAPVKTKSEDKSYGGLSLNNIPVNHKLHFKCLLQGEYAGQKLRVNTFAYNKSDKIVSQWSNEYKPTNKVWQPVSADYVAPAECSYLTIWVINESKHSAYFAQPSLTVGGFEQAKISPSASQPDNSIATDNKILQATVVTAVNSKFINTGVVTFPIPSLYKNQIPLTYQIRTEPPDALLSYKISKREDGLNYVCEATVKPQGKGAKVIWQALVFVGGQAPTKLPRATAAVPPGKEQWVRNTICVQCDDTAIKAKADELAKNTQDIETYARKVIKFTADNKGTGLPFKRLDAKSALGCGGSCTSRANLGAALLRAQGIPARTVSHLPAWCTSPMFEHWLTEYWHPGAGWVPLETTLEAFQPPQNTYVTLAISSASDEDKAADPVHLRVIMPGAAYLSGNEITSNFYPANLPDTDGVNKAIVLGVIKGSAKDLSTLRQTALNAFSRAYGATTRQYAEQHAAPITKAATTQSASKLIEALK